MTIIYVPRQEAHTQLITSIQDIIAITDTINPAEQQQYKRFIFCNMTPDELEIVECYLKKELSRQSGVTTSKVLPAKPDYIYLATIGHIKLR